MSKEKDIKAKNKKANFEVIADYEGQADLDKDVAERVAYCHTTKMKEAKMASETKVANAQSGKKTGGNSSGGGGGGSQPFRGKSGRGGRGGQGGGQVGGRRRYQPGQTPPPGTTCRICDSPLHWSPECPHRNKSNN